MIVTCTNCETSFQLDESRVPEQGIRVRCSRCKEAFFLQHPSVSQEQAIHQVASEAAARGGSPSPETTHDLSDAETTPPTPPAPAATDFGPSDIGPSDLSTSDVKASDINNEDEHEWEFSVDPNREVEDDVRLVAEDIDDLDVGSGLALEGEEADDSDIEIDPSLLDSVDIDVSGGEESAFGSIDDFSSLMDEADVQSAVDLDAGTDVSASAEVEAPSEAAVADAADSHSTVVASDDLGEPENWDFFGGQEEAKTGPAPSRVKSGAVLGRINLTRIDAGSEAAAEALPVDDVEASEPFSDALYGPASLGPGRTVALVEQLGRSVGWALSLGLIVVVLAGGGMPSARAFSVPSLASSLGTLDIESLRVERIDTARGETLLSISGSLRNPSSATVDLGGPLQISLLNADGVRIDGAAALAGLELAEADLRERDGQDLDMRRRAAIEGLATHAIVPGADWAFQAILPDAWPSAARFELGVGAIEPVRASLDDVPAVEEAALGASAEEL